MLKPYFRFYGLALKEYLPERSRKRLRVLYLVLAFIVGGVVSDFFGVPLVRPLKWIYNLWQSSYWAIVGLLAVIVFQCYVIEGARRVYERTLREADHIIKAAEKLARVHGKGTVIYSQCSPDSTEPLAKNTLWYWLKETESAIHGEFGQEKVDAFFQSVKGLKDPNDYSSIPATVHDQEEWVEAYLNALHSFIQQRREALTTGKSTEPKSDP